MNSKIEKAEKVRILTYARISSAKQSLEAQEEELRHHCDTVRYTAGSKYVSAGHESDIITTKKHWHEREGIMKVMGRAKGNQCDLVIFTSITRLGRTEVENYEIAEALNKAGVVCYFISENIYFGDGSAESDRIVFGIMSSLARAEREKKARRARRGYKKWKANNPDKVWGQQPKVRGETLRLMMALYKEKVPISRPWDAKRQKADTEAGEGMKWKYSYRDMEKILGIHRSTIQRMVKKLVHEGALEPRCRSMARWSKVTHISSKAAATAGASEKYKDKGFVTYDGEQYDRETKVFDKDGNMHPVYASNEELGPMSKPTGKPLKHHCISPDGEEFQIQNDGELEASTSETMEFMTAITSP